MRCILLYIGVALTLPLLRLCGMIDRDWWWVTSLMWGPLIIVTGLLAGLLLAATILSIAFGKRCRHPEVKARVKEWQERDALTAAVFGVRTREDHTNDPEYVRFRMRRITAERRRVLFGDEASV